MTSTVAFSVPVSTGANNVTSADLVKNTGTWNTHTDATPSSSLNATLSAIAGQIPSLTTTSGTTGITELDNNSTAAANNALTRAVDVKGALDALVDGAPDAMNTLNELAAALNDESDFAATLTTTLSGKAAKNGSSSENFAANELTVATSATMPKLLATSPGSSGAGLQIGSDSATGKYRIVVKDDSVTVYKHTTAIMTISG